MLDEINYYGDIAFLHCITINVISVMKSANIGRDNF